MLASGHVGCSLLARDASASLMHFTHALRRPNVVRLRGAMDASAAVSRGDATLAYSPSFETKHRKA
eukprot:5378709-Pleurochrysis_carterae.AAC.2